jgi:hypothetical protein
VIPQLEEELRVEEVQVRLIATQALGEMFSEKGGADLVKKYPTTWNVWLMRKNDKSAAVRLKLVESAKGLLVNLHDYRDTVDGQASYHCRGVYTDTHNRPSEAQVTRSRRKSARSGLQSVFAVRL